MNNSGIKPVFDKVLVKPDEVEVKSKGGIILPEQTRDKEKHARMEGTLIAVGANAFTESAWLEPPRVGDKILYDKYGGCLIVGKDGVEYRLINDVEIGAVIYG